MAYNLLVTLVSVFGLIQSVIWLGLSILALLVYLCVLPISPYHDEGDFYRVTIVKLYFEGPKCIPDGNYLGSFNTDYRNPEKVNLTTPDIVFGIMVAKIIFELLHFVSCCLLLKSRVSKNEKNMSKSVKNWSVLVLIMSALDTVLVCFLVLDVFALTAYFKDHYVGEAIYQKLWYLPLIVAATTDRFVVFWLWNVIMAFCFLCNCFKPGKKNFPIKEVEKFEPEQVRHSKELKTFPEETEEVKRSVKIREESNRDIEVQSMGEVSNFNEES